MDGNKDDALKCLNIGKAALAAGDVNRARKFLSKAQRLHPSVSVDELLAACGEENGKESQTPVKNNRDSSEISENSNNNPSNPDNSGGNSSPAVSRAYTDEQVQLVRQIRRNKDYYTILGLEKGCSVEEVRKAYRKLSLKVHPDKNKAPGAEDAFKSVSKAFQCLSDEEMRRNYDINGPQEEFELQQQQTFARRRRNTHQGFYAEEFDPDEIFRQFFFGGSQADFFSRAHVARTRAAAGSHNGRTQESGFNILTLLQILPILILFLVTYLPYSEPVYSLENAYPYQIRKITNDFGVQYFVKNLEFEKEYAPDSAERINLERQIIRDYKGHLARYCQIELQRRQWTGQKETPFCDKLRQFERVR